uniref:Uncharacterized protein n=1 Tax=Timema tahoe TaxID=61484 RepID=A0A7R9NYQ0_9NEOP|nr:unnamed protein product [Timema tahoe]
MKCEDTEEDNGRSMFWFPNSALGHLSFPFIKEEIKNEPDCYATQLKLESTNESLLYSIIKPEKTSNAPASGVCEQLGFKEELCFDESFIDDTENKIMEFSHNSTDGSNINDPLHFHSSSFTFVLTRPELKQFQTHCFTENLGVPVIEPGTSSVYRNSDH